MADHIPDPAKHKALAGPPRQAKPGGGRKPGRPSGKRAALSVERILEEALRLVDAQGVQGLTMRGLARQLGVDPMAIYHHLPNKAALLQGLVTRAFADLELARKPGVTWQTQLRGVAQAYRGLARQHPHLVLHLVGDLSAGGPAALQATELLYAALAQAGLAPAQIAVASDLVVDYLHGVALGEGELPQNAGKSRHPLFDLLAAQGGEYARQRYPELCRVADALPPNQQDWDADAGLELIIVGIGTLVPSA